jgi:hypothetical protein
LDAMDSPAVERRDLVPANAEFLSVDDAGLCQ